MWGTVGGGQDSEVGIAWVVVWRWRWWEVKRLVVGEGQSVGSKPNGLKGRMKHRLVRLANGNGCQREV